MMQAVIFDVDGTLWDASDAMALGWMTVMNEQFDPDFYLDGVGIRPILGRTPAELAEAIMPGVPEDKALRIFHVISKGSLPIMAREAPEPFEGFREVIPRLAEKYRLFIVSNCDSGYIEMFLDVTGLGEYFDGHLCPGDTGEGKAENIRTIMKQYGVETAVYVGDTEKDRRECERAGVPFIYASYGYGDVTGYAAKIDCPAELPDVLAEM